MVVSEGGPGSRPSSPLRVSRSACCEPLPGPVGLSDVLYRARSKPFRPSGESSARRLAVCVSSGALRLRDASLRAFHQAVVAACHALGTPTAAPRDEPCGLPPDKPCDRGRAGRDERSALSASTPCQVPAAIMGTVLAWWRHRPSFTVVSGAAWTAKGWSWSSAARQRPERSARSLIGRFSRSSAVAACVVDLHAELRIESSLVLVPVAGWVREDPRLPDPFVHRIVHVAVDPERGLVPLDEGVEVRGEGGVGARRQPLFSSGESSARRSAVRSLLRMFRLTKQARTFGDSFSIGLPTLGRAMDTILVSVQVDEKTLREVDEWRPSAVPQASEAEAVDALLHAGLFAKRREVTRPQHYSLIQAALGIHVTSCVPRWFCLEGAWGVAMDETELARIIPKWSLWVAERTDQSETSSSFLGYTDHAHGTNNTLDDWAFPGLWESWSVGRQD